MERKRTLRNLATIRRKHNNRMGIYEYHSAAIEFLSGTCCRYVSHPRSKQPYGFFSSVRFGARRTLGHISGAGAGSAFMLLSVGLGLHEIFTLYPYIQVVMKYCGATYILYLSWKILGNTDAIQAAGASHPMSFIGAAFFQLINPKSWIMASVAISTCLPTVFSITDIRSIHRSFCSH
ncbi:LysE family transporter (plasmid) [Serratia sp. PAMC26656]|uniref:LysE family translocator n=1 Tax=Serratia sp. PAMC26656 TaxID=2775909 RepID=UPI0018F4E4A7|nr:LysE family transporter [Serratia sp. PAMC26656]MBJ7889500.1 LysE family transporter [Serratia sp. PAMC26656]